MDAQYSEIANIVNASCPSGYDSAVLKADVGDDWSDQEIWCQIANDSIQPDLPSADSFKIGRSLRQLRKSMTIAGENPWSRCTFTLFPDGKFKFDVEYDD